MKKVLIIGGAGPTGKIVTAEGIRRGYSVRILTRSPDSIVSQKLSAMGCQILQGNLGQPWTFWEVIEGVDVVINCAHLKFSKLVTKRMQQFNIQQLIAFSSTRIESTVPCPSVKLLKDAEKCIQKSALDFTILRPSMIIGHDHDRNTSGIVRFMKKYRCLPLPNGGKAFVQPVGVHDVAKVVWDVLENDLTVQKTLTLAGSEALPFRQFVKAIQKAHDITVPIISVPISPIVPLARIVKSSMVPMLKRFAEDKVYSIEETKQLLDYDPETLNEIFERQKKNAFIV